jgi:diguanylate cyclase (GGDEF)-like protein
MGDMTAPRGRAGGVSGAVMSSQPGNAALPALDALTGCHSRAALDALVPEGLRHAAATGTECSLFLLDLDYFKSVNDAYGHARGDEILRGVADRLRGLLRDQDLLFRYGGDELVVFLPEMGHEPASAVARRLVDGVGATAFPGRPPLSLSISLGVASFPVEATDPEGLLAVADRRNYLAKRRGRAQAVFDDEAAPAAEVAESRLLERDAVLATATDFLARLPSQGSGTLRVTGLPGAGHSRFLDEVAKIARLRGLRVLARPAAEQLGRADYPAGTLIVLDVNDSAALDAARGLLRQATPAAPVGLIHATTHPRSDVATAADDDTIELKPWSAPAVRAFLRTALRGEPSPQLVNWLDSHSGGLPSLLSRELTRLTETAALEWTETSGWTLNPAVLAEAERRTAPQPEENLAASMCRLPPYVPDFTGRDAEVAELVELARQAAAGSPAGVSVASVYGQPGVGKTVLAVHLAHALAEHFPDGQWYLDMLGTDNRPLDPTDALGRLLAALGVPAERIPPSVAERTALFRSLTHSRRLLLVLDNVVNEGQVRPLLPSSPTFLVFVTSRRSLAGLMGARRFGLETFSPQSAVDLLAEIAGRERVAAESAAAFEVARLCGHLPLALRIAGNRLASRPAWSIDHLVRQLGNSRRRLGVLTSGDLELRAIFAVSYRQLSEPAQAAFRRLGLIGGPDFDAALAGVVLEQDPFDAEDLLGELVDVSLLELAAAPGRYRFNDLLRLFAREVLEHGDGAEAAHDHEERLLTWLLTVAARAGTFVSPQDEDGPPPRPTVAAEPSWATSAAAVSWLDAEWGNWLSALRLAADRNRHEEVLCLAWSMHWYSDVRWFRSEWREVFTLGVAAARAIGDRAAECVMVDYLAWTYTVHHQIAEAEPLLTEALHLAREVGNRTEEGWALLYLGNCRLRTDRENEAKQPYGEAVKIFRELDFATGLSIALSHLGEAHRLCDELTEALAYQEQAMVIATRTDNFVGLGLATSRAGHILAALGRPQEAAVRYEQAIAAYDMLEVQFEKGMILQSLAPVQQELGLIDAAVASLEAAVRIFVTACDPGKQAEALAALGEVVQQQAGRAESDSAAYAEQAAALTGQLSR